jgi:hypothetical protein
MIITFFAVAPSRAARRSPRLISRRVARATVKACLGSYACPLASVPESWRLPTRYHASARIAKGANHQDLMTTSHLPAGQPESVAKPARPRGNVPEFQGDAVTSLLGRLTS